MTVYFADSSALGRAYLPDEEGHEELRWLRLPDAQLLVSRLAMVEVPRALVVAARLGRIDQSLLTAMLDEFDAATGPDGSMTGLELTAVWTRARELAMQHELRTLDALHLATAERQGVPLAGDDGLVFVTRDARQREAARGLGLAVG